MVNLILPTSGDSNLDKYLAKLYIDDLKKEHSTVNLAIVKEVNFLCYLILRCPVFVR